MRFGTRVRRASLPTRGTRFAEGTLCRVSAACAEFVEWIAKGLPPSGPAFPSLEALDDLVKLGHDRYEADRVVRRSIEGLWILAGNLADAHCEATDTPRGMEPWSELIAERTRTTRAGSPNRRPTGVTPVTVIEAEGSPRSIRACQ